MAKVISWWCPLSVVVMMVAFQANAIGISSMLEYTDDSGRAVFTVTNGESYRQYINTAVAELSVVNGEIKREPYNKDNIDIWALDVRPARTILEPGFKKNIVVQYHPKGIVRSDRDRVFQLSFVPTPYFAQGEEKQQVKIAFGFAPLLIVPAKETMPLAYDLRYLDGKVVVTNKGTSFFSLSLDGCEKSSSERDRKECSISTTVLAGRTLEIKLPAGMTKQPTLQAKMFSYGNKYKAEKILTKLG